MLTSCGQRQRDVDYIPHNPPGLKGTVDLLTSACRTFIIRYSEVTGGYVVMCDIQTKHQASFLKSVL